MYFYRSQFEEEPDIEKIKQFHENSSGREIVLDKCEIRTLRFSVVFINVISQLFVLKSKVKIINVIIGSKKLTNFGFAYINIVVEISEIYMWYLRTSNYASVGFLKFTSTEFVR